MPKCPKCGKEIEYLDYTQPAKASVKPAGGYLEYCWWDEYVAEGEYECPECGEVLFDSEEEAERFFGLR